MLRHIESYDRRSGQRSPFNHYHVRSRVPHHIDQCIKAFGWDAVPAWGALLDSDPSRLYPEILRTCRLLYDEGIATLYGPRHVYDFTGQIAVCPAFLNDIGPRGRFYLRRMRLCWYLCSVGGTDEFFHKRPEFNELQAWKQVCQILATRKRALQELEVVIAKQTNKKRIGNLRAGWTETSNSTELIESAGTDLISHGSRLMGFKFLEAIVEIKAPDKLVLRPRWYSVDEPSSQTAEPNPLQEAHEVFMKSLNQGFCDLVQARMQSGVRVKASGAPQIAVVGLDQVPHLRIPRRRPRHEDISMENGLMF